jgi:carboxyl-terminal processing protease
MKKSQPNYAAAVIAGGVILASGFFLGFVTNNNNQKSLLDEAVNKIVKNSVTNTTKENLERAAIDGMLRSLGDKWSQYLPESGTKSFENLIEGQYSGIGVWLRSDEEGAVGVAGVVPSSPADFAKIQVGDVIKAIDGVLTIDKSLSDVSEMLNENETNNAILYISRSQELLTFNVKKTKIKSNPVTAKRLDNNVIIISLTEFSRGSARSLRAVLASFGSTRAGVILDLRGNPGGLLLEATDVAGAFLNGGLVVEFYQPDKPQEVFNAIGDGDARTPLVVLVDRGTASAAEIVAAALQDRNRAIIVGERTFGKSSVQNSQELSNGSTIDLTVGYYLTPAGKRLDGQGVIPDIEVAATKDKSIAESRGLQVLLSLISTTEQLD